jgi:50S ribosomal protein L16 3-hydroxylase
MHILQKLLGPVTVREFFDKNFTRFPFAMPDQATLYVQDFSDADFAAMVEDARSTLRIVRDGRLVRDRARLSWAEAQAYYRGGHTLLVRHAERSSAKLQALAEAFARVFHAPVDIQVYLTPDQSQAFGWHYDLEEVFIIQVQGCKAYTVRQNTLNPWPVWENLPADLRYDRETSRLRLTCRLEAGDWLYIPSGWWHVAETQTASIHLSVGVMPVVGLHLFAFLQHHLAHDPFWCQRLTWVPQEEAGRPTRLEHAHQRWDEMRAQLQQVLAEEQTFRAFLGYLMDPQRARSIESPADHP